MNKELREINRLLDFMKKQKPEALGTGFKEGYIAAMTIARDYMQLAEIKGTLIDDEVMEDDCIEYGRP